VSSQIRKTDFVARFGGEEFVFLLPETTPEQAKGAMEKVREAVASLNIDAGGRRDIKITASFGVAGFAEDDEADRVFTRADAALYQAKSAGRDRVVSYSATAD
jgi:diguanylate cyclase